jgi:hypothetical protein
MSSVQRAVRRPELQILFSRSGRLRYPLPDRDTPPRPPNPRTTTLEEESQARAKWTGGFRIISPLRIQTQPCAVTPPLWFFPVHSCPFSVPDTVSRVSRGGGPPRVHSDSGAQTPDWSGGIHGFCAAGFARGAQSGVPCSCDHAHAQWPTQRRVYGAASGNLAGPVRGQAHPHRVGGPPGLGASPLFGTRLSPFRLPPFPSPPLSSLSMSAGRSSEGGPADRRLDRTVQTRNLD